MCFHFFYLLVRVFTTVRLSLVVPSFSCNPICMAFHSVLGLRACFLLEIMDWIEFHWVLLGFAEFFCVSLRDSGFCWVCTEWNWLLIVPISVTTCLLVGRFSASFPWAVASVRCRTVASTADATTNGFHELLNISPRPTRRGWAVPSSGFFGFYRVLLGSIGFYRVLLDSTVFYRVSIDLMGLLEVSFGF